MLRARKKDVRIKPNRKLDKRSSRGMLYENEELRLRTIEINAEVERGQTDIKKLRRENDHLRREMWALRDEYERLEKLIKHLDLAGTGSEHHQRGHQHSDGEGGGRAGDDDDDEDDRASPSINGRNTNSEGSEDDEPEGMDRSAASEGFAAGMSRSKSQTVMMTVESRPPMATPVSATTACQMDQQGTCHCHGTPCGQHRAVYVECGNPDKDNIENYQKAYGRMPRRCSSAGSKVYVATQHFHPHAPVQTASVSSVTDSTGRVCYESLSAVKSRYSTSGMEDEDGYAACSHPVRVDLRDFLHPPGCSQSRSVSVSGESGAGLLPPTTPPPPIPMSSSSSLSSSTTTTTSQVTTTAIHSHPVHRGDFVVQEDLVEAPDEGGSSGVEADDEPSAAIGGAGGFPPDTPSEDGDFNLDHLVNIVRSFQQEQQLHQSGLVVATCTPPRPTSPDVLVEEADDDVISRGSSSPEAGGMATIKRRPVSSSTSQQQQQQHQRHRQMSIIEKESSNDPVVVAEILSPVGAATESSSTELGGDCGAVTYAQPTGRGAVRPSRRNSFSSSSSSSSSSASGSPTAAHSSTVVFLNNNNNNNNNMNNNKKMGGGGGGGVVVGGSSGGNLGNSRGSSSSVPDTMAAVAACAATSSTIDSIMVTSSRKSSSPIRLVQQQALPPPPAQSSCPALEPTVVVSAGQGALSRRRVAETGDGQLDERSCLSVYPLPDGDASASLLRLHAVDPHTVSFDVKDLTGARSVTVQEVIDQLEQQLDPTRCHVRGVRMLAGSLFFISLDSLRSLQYLLRHSFRLRGHRVRLTDVSAQTWIVSLTGVPHYISDATVSLLLAAFGTIIGDVERRFFRGVDTGERLVRFRLKGHAKLPRHITVGGCRIQVRRMSPAPSSSSQHTEDNTPATFRETLTGQSQFHPTGMNRRLRLDSSQTDYQHPSTTTTTTHFQSSSNANNETANAPSSSSSLVGGGDGIYGTKMSTASTGDPAKKSVPKIGRSFEYRSQLRVDLRMSAEVPVPPLLGDEDLSSSGGIPAGTTPSCPVCDQQQSSSHPTTRGDLRRHSPPPPPLPPALVIHRCRHHESVSGTSPVGPGIPVVVTTTGGPSGDGRVHRESPPKSRVSVNFDETAAASSGSRVCSGTGTIRPSNTKTSTSSSSNGILRKSVSGEEPPTESGNDGGSSGAGSADAAGQAKNKNGVRMTTAKKTARSFSLVDTFRVNKERRKPIVRVETVIENTSAANPEEGVRTLVVRRDSTESSSRSSRSSRKSNELPWCGCWGNGCL